MRWALLEHDYKGVHYDLLIEREESCLTFTFGGNPFTFDSGKAVRRPDHRKHYLTWEGPVTKGRGTVKRIMGGQCSFLLVENRKIAAGLNTPDKIEIRLDQVEGNDWNYIISRPLPD